MKFRLALAAATSLALPVLAHAQPVTGPYVGLEAGTSIETPTDNSYRFRLRGTNYSVSSKTFFRPDVAGIASVGYGFGNGFRVQIDGIFIKNTAATTDFGGDSTSYKTTGAEKKYGGMADILYDFKLGVPVYPYVGVGAGYEEVSFNRDLRTGLGSGVFQQIGGSKGSFAYNVIAGLSFPIPGVPGLSLTGEYRFQQLTSTRSYNGALGYSDTTPLSYRGHGPVKVGQESDHTFLLGMRYQIFNPPPPAPPAPAPAPVAAPAPAPAKTYLVFFDWDKYNLTPRALNIISQAAADSKTNQVTTLNVSGYTDTSGTPTYNMGLSWRRAKAVAAQLVADGVPASEIETHGYGETHLLVPTGPGVREPQNRRVEIVLQ